MTTVQIFHADRPTFGVGETPTDYTYVADCDVSGEVSRDPAHLLECGYLWTQNIEGSWSRGPTVGGRPNGDYRPTVTVRTALPVVDGRTYGLRSSSVGDVFMIDGKAFVVAGMGFEPLPEGHPFARYQEAAQ